jgi:thiamine biosynthesis protein ThiS
MIKNFFLNGRKYCTNYHLTILDLITYFDYNVSLIILEYNNLIYTKKKWQETLIHNNDKIEIITIVGGG